MNPSADSQIHELSRRHFLKSGAGVAAGAVAGIAAQGAAQAQTATVNSTGQPPVGGPGIETQTGHAV